MRCLFNTYLKECIILQVCISKKYAISLSRSHSQTVDEFDLFMLSLEKFFVDISNLNLHFVLIVVEFKAKSRNQSTSDTTTTEVAHLDSLLTLYGLNQIN